MESEHEGWSIPRLQEAGWASPKKRRQHPQTNGDFPEIKRQYENDNFSCVDRGLEEAVDDSEKSDVMRFFDAEMVAARQVKYNVMIGHEVRVGALFFTEGIWGTDQDASANWDVKATDIPLDFMTAFNSLNTVGEIPNTVIVGQDVFTQMSTNTEMQNFIRGNRPTDSRLDITAQMVAEAFAGHGIRQVLIGRASFDSADEGLTPVLTPAWPVDFAWVGRIGTGQPLGGGAARTFVWNQEGGLFVTESYREEKRRSEIVRVHQNTAEKVLDVNAGVLIDTRVA